MDSHTYYPTTEVTLPPGSVLALYTDGLVEAAGTDIDHTTRNLAQHLAQNRRRILEDLADTLIHHAEHGTPGHDDIALLLIRPTQDGG
ncbi:SpoIIE family protein phosphatase [Streptomyces coelicoflavus]|uniref:SpoIIE family protein phosphatase n=1 Tax=Streptomyces coelicoflavus TaxID=285562 RepID=UPI0030B8E0A4